MADVTETQLENSNEPQFVEALGAKRESQEHAKTAPVGCREGESGLTNQAKGQAEAIKESGLAEMVGQRGEAFGLLDGLFIDTAKNPTLGPQDSASFSTELFRFRI